MLAIRQMLALFVPALRAAIFDMDGLLIDTEPIWRRSEMEVFAGVGLHLTKEQCLETMGVRIAEIVDIWYRRHPWTGPSRAEITRRIEDAVIMHVRTEGEPQPGVHAAMEAAKQAGLHIAIASSSGLTLIDAVLERLGIGQYVEVACSGADEDEGKPHPAVYLTTARRLGIAPEECLALEDSPNGVLSAKAAGMTCIAIPDPHLADDSRFDRADLRLSSLTQVTPALLDELRGAGVGSS